MSDSIRNLIIRMAFVIDGPNGSQRLELPVEDYFLSASINLRSDGVWSGEIVLFDPETDIGGGPSFLELLFFAAGYLYHVELQWKIFDGLSISTAPMYRGLLTNPVPNFEGVGTRYTLGIATDNTVAGMASTPQTLCGFPAGMQVTDAVRQIAQLHGWPTSTVFNGGEVSTIEDSSVVFKEDVQVVNKGHIQFIRSELRPLATNAFERQYYFFFDALGAVHFHSDFWLGRSVRTYTYRDFTGEVKDFTVNNDSLLTQYIGGGNATFIAPDAASGDFVKVTANVDGGVSPAQVNGYGGARYAVETTDQNQRKGVIVRDRASLEVMAKAEYNRARSRTFKGNLSVMGTHDLIPQAFVTINRQRANGSLHSVSGDYSINTVHHELTGNSWTTDAEVLRQANLPPEGLTRTLLRVTQVIDRALNIKRATSGQVIMSGQVIKNATEVP